jgi:hypothetical protein
VPTSPLLPPLPFIDYPPVLPLSFVDQSLVASSLFYRLSSCSSSLFCRPVSCCLLSLLSTSLLFFLSLVSTSLLLRPLFYPPPSCYFPSLVSTSLLLLPLSFIDWPPVLPLSLSTGPLLLSLFCVRMSPVTSVLTCQFKWVVCEVSKLNPQAISFEISSYRIIDNWQFSSSGMLCFVAGKYCEVSNSLFFLKLWVMLNITQRNFAEDRRNPQQIAHEV